MFTPCPGRRKIASVECQGASKHWPAPTRKKVFYRPAPLNNINEENGSGWPHMAFNSIVNMNFSKFITF
jgi:hypothetical protein